MSEREQMLEEVARSAVRIIARRERDQVSREGQEFLSAARRALLADREPKPPVPAPPAIPYIPPDPVERLGL